MLVKKQEKGNTLGAGEKRGKSECTIEKSSLVPMLKIKPDVQSCGNYRRIKLMSHTSKIWERAAEVRLRDKVLIVSSSMVSCQETAPQTQCLL